MKTIQVPWSDPGSGFTALFEALVIDWLQAANTSAVSRLLGLTWDEVDGIKQRAVARGLARRELAVPEDIGVDETSFQKRHEYVTVVADTQANVIHWVSDGRGKESLSSYFECFEVAELQQVRSITMDMWRPFIQTTLERVPGGASKIAFDKFHVAMHLGQAVDKVRREENRQLLESGDESLKGTKYLWLYHPEKLAERTSESRLLDFDSLLRRSLRDSSSLAPQGNADGDLGPCRSRVCAPLLRPVVLVGDSFTPSPDEASRTHDPASPRRGPERHRARRHQRQGRGLQHQDPVAQAISTRLQKPRPIPPSISTSTSAGST